MQLIVFCSSLNAAVSPLRQILAHVPECSGRLGKFGTRRAQHRVLARIRTFVLEYSINPRSILTAAMKNAPMIDVQFVEYDATTSVHTGIIVRRSYL